MLVVDDEPLDANIATAGLLEHAAFLASSALSSCFLAWLSARRALSTAVSAASFCASAWALVFCQDLLGLVEGVLRARDDRRVR